MQASTALWLVGACWRNFDSRSCRTVASGRFGRELPLIPRTFFGVVLFFVHSGHIAARSFLMTHSFLNCPSGGLKVFVQGHDGDKISDLTSNFLVAVSLYP